MRMDRFTEKSQEALSAAVSGGATVISLKIAPAAQALLPLVVGLLAAFVAYGRWRVAPLRPRAVDSLAARSTR